MLANFARYELHTAAGGDMRNLRTHGLCLSVHGLCLSLLFACSSSASEPPAEASSATTAPQGESTAGNEAPPVATSETSSNTGEESPEASAADEDLGPVEKEQPPVKPVRMMNGSFDRVGIKDAEGRPKDLKRGSRTAYWIWVDKEQTWHIRTTSGDKNEFRGVISPEEDELANFSSNREELKDRFRFRGEKVMFALRTGQGLDGFDFDAEYAKCLRFRLMIDGKNATEVLLGKNAKPAPSNRFRICYKSDI